MNGIVYERGRKLISSPKHPNKNSRGYYYEYRLIMEKHLGRYLKKDEVIHHIDGDHTNNKLSNLLLTDSSKHATLHKEKESVSVKCEGCGKIFSLKPGVLRRRKKINHSINCSRKCASKLFFPPSQKHNPETTRKVKAGYANGWSGYKIAEELGISRKTVYAHKKL